MIIISSWCHFIVAIFDPHLIFIMSNINSQNGIWNTAFITSLTFIDFHLLSSSKIVIIFEEYSIHYTSLSWRISIPKMDSEIQLFFLCLSISIDFHLLWCSQKVYNSLLSTDYKFLVFLESQQILMNIMENENKNKNKIATTTKSITKVGTILSMFFSYPKSTSSLVL